MASCSSAVAGTPPEIWRIVFSFASASTTSHSSEYRPFQQGREFEENSRYVAHESLRLQTCLAVVCVCRLWQAVGEEFLYRDVKLGNNAGALYNFATSLQHDREDGLGGVGRYVRRLELPTTCLHSQSAPANGSSKYYTKTSPSVSLKEILRFCPRLEVLIRPNLRMDAEDIALWGGLTREAFPDRSSLQWPLCPCLKRLEWSESDLDLRFHGSASGRRLTELIAHAPDLRYLYISSDRAELIASLPLPQSLTTLRLNRAHYTPRHTKPISDLQNQFDCGLRLTNLILHTTPSSALLPFLTTVGCNLRVMEFTFAPQISYSSSQMQRIFSRCPNIEELVLHLGAPEISPLRTLQHEKVRKIRLRINPDDWFPYKLVVLSQFQVLLGPSFPALEQVILHDDTRSFIRRDSATSLLTRMFDRGCRVLYPDGTPVLLGRN